MNISLSPLTPENLVLRDGFDRPVPRQSAHFPQRLNLVLSHGISPDFRDGVQLFVYTAIRHWVNPEFIGWTLLRTHGVYCRESADTGPVVLKVVRVTGAAFSGHHGPINMSVLFTYITPCWYEVGGFKEWEVR